MVIDFSNFDAKHRPTLVLKNMSGRVLQTLGVAFDVSLEASYNEVSTLTFSYPAHLEGQRVPGYEKIVGMRIIHALGIGHFIIVDPSITEDAVREVKTVKAYSLEYEFSFKKMSLPSGTYKFYDAVSPANTIFGMILQDMPGWGPGTIDSVIRERYRTFSVENENLYDLMKNKLQNSYGCIFTFDTDAKTVSVRNASADANMTGVYISLDNLAKEIEIEENTENIFTCLDVNGAEGVTIRNVNPTGTNKIYNLDYFMNRDNFSEEMIGKWNSWVEAYQGRQELYFNITVQNALEHMELETEKAALTKLKGELKVLESQQAVDVEAAAKGIPLSTSLETHKANVEAKLKEISDKEALIKTLTDNLAASQAELKSQTEALDWVKGGWFSEAQVDELRNYIKEDAITDSSFVTDTVDSFSVKGESYPTSSVSIALTKADAEQMMDSNISESKGIAGARGGQVIVTVDGAERLSANNIRCTFDYVPGASSCKVTASFYTEKGCVTVTGTMTHQITKDESAGTGSIVLASANVGTTDEPRYDTDLYITTETSAFVQRAVEWDLYDYGREALARVAEPTYSFTVSSGNFLAMDEFDKFRRELTLGEKLVLNLGETFGVLSPVLIGAHIDFESKDLELEFNNNFRISDAAFKIADLLEDSVSMGKSVDFNQWNYNAYVNAGGTNGVRELIESMTDIALNSLYSSTNQAFSIDESGIHLRKFSDDKKTAYDPVQIWMNNEGIMFTQDGWQTASMAIGSFTDDNGNQRNGIVADLLVGKVLAGESLTIQSTKEHGGVAEFRVGNDGASLYNAVFDIVDDSGQLSLNPEYGLVVSSIEAKDDFYGYDSETGEILGMLSEDGTKSYMKVSEIVMENVPKANFWADLYGDVWMRGNIYADNGYFSGEVHATSGDFTGTIHAEGGEFEGTVNATKFLLDGVDISDIFKTEDDEELGKVLKIGNLVIDGETGAIYWSSDNTPCITKYSVLYTPGAQNVTDAPVEQKGGSYLWYSVSWTDWVANWTGSTEVQVWCIRSYDGGDTWEGPTLCQGKNGEDGDGATDEQVFNVLTNYGSKEGLFWNAGQGFEDAQLYINATMIGWGNNEQSETLGYLATAEGMKIDWDSGETSETLVAAINSKKSLVLKAAENIRLTPNDGRGKIYLTDTTMGSNIMIGYISTAGTTTATWTSLLDLIQENSATPVFG